MQAMIQQFLRSLGEQEIARAVKIPHDEARIRFPLNRNTVQDYDEFEAITSAYVQHHHSACVGVGGQLSPSRARSMAKQILGREYQRRNGTAVNAFYDALNGTNGGLRRLLDIIAEQLQSEAVEDHIRDVFDRFIRPISWEQKLQFITAFIDACDHFLDSSIVRSQPERYAQNYEELVRSYVRGLEQTSSIFRRL